MRRLLQRCGSLIASYRYALALLLALATPGAEPAPAPPSQFSFYSPDGAGNNARHPLWGSAGQPRIRSHPPLNGYADGLSQPLGAEADHGDGGGLHLPPSAHRVLTELFRVAPRHENKETSQLLIYFGQFVAKDITRSGEDPDDEMPIKCGGWAEPPQSPHILDPVGASCAVSCPAGGGAGAAEMPFFRMKRSAADPATGSASTTINFATAFLDLDHIYGPIVGGPPESSVRAFVGGKMVLDEHSGLPPKDGDGMYVTADPDIRLTPSLTALAAVFLRYHNLRADAHAAAADPGQNPTDEELYWAARMDTTAAYQNIVEEKYVPTALGETLDPYVGYDPEVDPSVDVFFSTCAFRYGHSGLSGWVRLLDGSFRPTPSDPVPLRDAFNRTEAVLGEGGVAGGGPAAVLRGMAAEPAKAIDASFVDDVAFFTQQMAVRNVQRGRDAGLPSYNDAREWFNLSRVQSIDELAGGDEKLARALQGLYGEDGIDDVEPYVGGLLESPTTHNNLMGPLMTASMRDQFGRLRDGDRFWYKARLTEEEIGTLPSLSDMIKMTFGEEEMRHFPSDSFAAVEQFAVAKEGQGQRQESTDGSSLSLIDGVYTASWALSQSKNKTQYIYMTLNVGKLVQRGYISIGWGSQTMRGAEMWFCTAINDVAPLPSRNCTPAPLAKSAEGSTTATDPLFSCCVAPGPPHTQPHCAGEGYPLKVVDSCISQETSFVTIRTPICKPDGEGGKCFSLPRGEIDFIAAFSPSMGPHGFSHRTMGRLDLNSGWGASVASDSAEGGLFALHGITMLICWFALVPAAVYIVRYMKSKPWRLTAHITLVGISGSLVFAMATAAIVSIDGTSFGTADAGSVFSEHKIVGLSIIGFVFFMLMTGEARRTREIYKFLDARWKDRTVLIAHRCGGFVLVGLAWWNCYTGLVQISAYEADEMEITWGSTQTTSFDMKFFGIFQRYIFFPLIGAICLIFLATEIQMRRSSGTEHINRVEAVRRGSISIWGSKKKSHGLETMSIDTFLNLTRNGSAFCIVDGMVVDIASFQDFHPGGSRMLRFAIGADITEHLIGSRDVDGIRHVHSPAAWRTLRSLVKARLDVPENSTSLRMSPNSVQEGSRAGARRAGRLSQRRINLLVFTEATIVDINYVTTEKKLEAKPVLRVRLALKKEQGMDTGTPLPSTTFIFRGKDSFGGTIERSYTPVKCYVRDAADIGGVWDHSGLPIRNMVFTKLKRSITQKEEIVYDFLISLVPQGKMSLFLMKKKPGSHIMVQGPLVNEKVLRKVNDDDKKCPDVILIAAGTGIAPMIQLIDYFCAVLCNPGSSEPPKPNGGVGRPRVFLTWIVRSKVLSFEGAAQLRERSQRFRENFNYFIIYHDDASLKHDASSTGQCEIALKKPALLTTCKSTFSNTKRMVGLPNTVKSADAFQSENSDSAHLDTISSQNEDSVGNADDEETTPIKPFEDDDAARREFLDQYHAKKRLDKELIARLLHLATGKDCSSALDYSPEGCMHKIASEIPDSPSEEGEEEDQDEDDNKARSPYHNTLVAVSGRPTFDNECVMALKELGLDDDQIVTFSGGHVPASKITLWRNKAITTRTDASSQLQLQAM